MLRTQACGLLRCLLGIHARIYLFEASLKPFDLQKYITRLMHSWTPLKMAQTSIGSG